LLVDVPFLKKEARQTVVSVLAGLRISIAHKIHFLVLINRFTMSSTCLPPSIDEQDDTRAKPILKSRGGILSTKTADACLDWMLFPALIFVQFGLTMYYSQMKEGILVMDWKVVHSTILVFCITAGFYRQILRLHSDSIFLLLLPEMFTNMILLATLGDFTTAYNILVAMTIVLLLIGSMIYYWAQASGTPSDYKQLVDVDAEEVESDEEEWIC
jgi:hypothetical protein